MRKPSMFQPLLVQIAKGLEKRSIPYMVIGGQAVLLYGEPRFTRDIDVTLGVGPDRLKDVLDLIRETGWQTLPDSPVDFVSRTMVLPCRDPRSDIRIDFVFSFSPYEAQAMKRAHQVQWEGQIVKYASPEDLVIHKIVAGRPQDLADVLSVFRKNRGLDRAYILKWLEDFSKALSQPLGQRFEEVLKQLDK